jgi:hypothetical protein
MGNKITEFVADIKFVEIVEKIPLKNTKIKMMELCHFISNFFLINLFAIFSMDSKFATNSALCYPCESILKKIVCFVQAQIRTKSHTKQPFLGLAQQ